MLETVFEHLKQPERGTSSLEDYLRSGFFKKGGDPNASSPDGETLLHRAVFSGNWRAVQKLLDGGANPSLASRSGVTPLIVAVQMTCAAYQSSAYKKEDREKILNMLLAAGADVNALGARFGIASPIHYAAQMGIQAVVEVLIRHGGNVNLRDYQGETPMDHANGKDGCAVKPEMLSLLKKHGGISSR